MKELVGSWSLVSYVTEGPDGTQGQPYGEAVGRLTYDARGHMSGQVMRPGRPAVVHGETGLSDVRAAYAGYIAYFGTYEVNEARDTVVHHVHGALNPSWVGGDQTRRMHLDGNRLILWIEVRKGDATIRHTLTWMRIA